MLNTAVSIAHFVGNATGKENFADTTQMTVGGTIAAIIFIVIYILLVLLLGKWLFNTVLCALFPSVKPATSIWQVLGLMILLHLLLP